MKIKHIFIVSCSTLHLLHAIDMNEYTVIEGEYYKSYLNGHLSLDSGNQDQTSYDAHLDTHTKIIHTMAPFAWEFESELNSDFSRGENKGDTTIEGYDAYAAARFDNYLQNDDTLFLYGGADLGYRKQIIADSADNPYLKLGTGIGYGRMYDATPLALALRIEEELMQYKLITQSLSDELLLALARLIQLQAVYSKKDWYDSIDTLFINSGVLSGESLGAFGIVKINEIIGLEKISERFHGWKIRGGLGQILSNYDAKSEGTTLDSEFEYGRPMGYKAQITQRAAISKILDEAEPIDFQLRHNLSYTYEVADRVDWENGWRFELERYHNGTNLLANSLSTGFRYYVANRLTFETTLSLIKADSADQKSIKKADWEKALFVGIRYRLK